MLLRRADVVDGALKFLDAEGLDGLTMRKLGAALNVQGGALYRHFPNKAALLHAMADKLVEGVGDPLPDVSWRDQIYMLGDRFRTALLAHRDGARLVGGLDRTLGGTNTITAGDLAVNVLCGAGLPPAQAGWLAFALFYYVLGHTIEEQAQVNPLVGDYSRSRKARLATDVSPQYAEALDSLTSSDPAERFTYGLNTFIEGVASQIPPTRPVPATR
jgi:TetR/AcrR family tetracycline transcriptional repressor